jgi:hypothetical protein
MFLSDLLMSPIRVALLLYGTRPNRLSLMRSLVVKAVTKLSPLMDPVQVSMENFKTLPVRERLLLGKSHSI